MMKTLSSLSCALFLVLFIACGLPCIHSCLNTSGLSSGLYFITVSKKGQLLFTGQIAIRY
jgi:hypothetical protein